MIQTLKDYTASEWFLLIQLVVIWFWLGAQAWRALVSRVICLITGKTLKGRVHNAVNDIIDAYDIKPGQKVTVVLSGGIELVIDRSNSGVKL